MVDREAALEESLRDRSRGRLHLLAFTVSPDGRWAVTLLRVRDTGCWLESLYEYGADGWLEHTTSNGGLAYTGIGEDDDGNSIGVLRYYGEARADSEIALVRWCDAVHEVPVQHGHFAFVAWDASESEDHNPEVVGFR